MKTLDSSVPNIWLEELRDILRGASGGFLFGVPLLYTVEVWSIGSSARPSWLLAALGITFVVVYLLTQSTGFRRNLNPQPIDALMESVEALSIGIVCAAIALILLQRITFTTPLTEALGKLVFEGIPFSLGVALARSTLRRDRTALKDRRMGESPPQGVSSTEQSSLRTTLADLDASLIGAIIIAFSIAPTEEIPILAAAIPPLWLLLIMVASLLVSYAIVFVSGFTDTAEPQQKFLLDPVTETLVAYIVSLLASVLMLVFFHQLNFQDPWPEWLSDTIVLSLPASIGGAAGRIII